MKRILIGLVVIAGVPLLASGSTYGLYGMSVEHASQDDTGTLYGMQVVGTGTLNPAGGDFIGQFRLTFQANLPSSTTPSATPPPGYGVIGSSFTAFCMELDVAVGIADKGKDLATYSFSMTDTVPQQVRAYPSQPRVQPWANGPQQASYLYNTYASRVYAGLTDLERDVAAAALQAAIWTSLYGEGVYNVKNTSEQQAVYSLWLAYVNDTQWRNQSYNSSWWQGTDLDGTIQQGLIGPEVVPEPKETGILCGLFLTGLLGWEIRRRTIRSAQRPP